MNLKNTSRALALELTPLISFVNKMSYVNGKDVFLEVTDTEGQTSGCAWQDGIRLHIKIDINIRRFRFPYTNSYKKRAGSIRIFSWQEEFILYYAHECRHLDQFKRFITPKQAEVDAEKFCHTVLGYWRLREERKRVLG